MLWVPNTTSTHGARSTMVRAVLLRHAAADRDLHVGVARLGRAQLAEVAVELVVGVLAHRAGVEDDDVGDLGPLARGQAGEVDVAGRLEQAGEALGVVDVHLAAVRADVVGPGRAVVVGAVATGAGVKFCVVMAPTRVRRAAAADGRAPRIWGMEPDGRGLR